MIVRHMGTAVLETPRLILRRFVPEDLEPMFRNCWCEQAVWKWTNYAPMNSVSDVILKANMFTSRWLGAYSDPKRYSWAICLKADNQPIGRLFGMHPTDDDVELAYELGSLWWNQGLMTEAVQTAIAFFLLDVGLPRVHAYHASENPASGRVMQKSGMRHIGIIPNGCTCNAGTFDRFDYEILSADLLQK